MRLVLALCVMMCSLCLNGVHSAEVHKSRKQLLAEQKQATQRVVGRVIGPLAQPCKHSYDARCYLGQRQRTIPLSSIQKKGVQ